MCTRSSSAIRRFSAITIARTILDSMGYDYIVFDDHHFNEDLQWKDAVPMF